MSDFGEYYSHDFDVSGKLKKFVEYRQKSINFDFVVKLDNGVCLTIMLLQLNAS